MSDLPPQVHEAGLLFQQPRFMNDPEAMREIIAWGHAQIDVSYPEDPLRAPLNPFRRWRAHWEWDRAIRTAGKELRGTIANALVEELKFQIEERQIDRRARAEEARRRESAEFDSNLRVSEFERMEEIRFKTDKKRMRLGHELQQKAEDNASRRRKEERINETAQEITLMISKAVYEATGTSSYQEVLDLVQQVSAEVIKIRKNKKLTHHDKHLQIKTLLDTLPMMLRRVQES